MHGNGRHIDLTNSLAELSGIRSFAVYQEYRMNKSSLIWIVALVLTADIAWSQATPNRSLVYNSPTVLYRWDLASTWQGGVVANQSSDFVLVGDGSNNFSSQSLWVAGSNIVGGSSVSIGGFDASSNTSGNIFISGSTGNIGKLALTPTTSTLSTLGVGKTITLSGQTSSTTTASDAVLEGNTLASLSNSGTIRGGSGSSGSGAIRNLSLVNTATGRLESINVFNSSVQNHGILTNLNLVRGTSITQTGAAEIRSPNGSTWIRDNSSISGGSINASGMPISIWDSSVIGSTLKGTTVGFVNGSMENIVSEANSVSISFNSAVGTGTTIATGSIAFSRMDTTYLAGQGVGNLQLNGATLSNHPALAQGYLYNQGRITGTGTLRNLQILQSSSGPGSRVIEASGGVIGFGSSANTNLQIQDQNLTSIGSGSMQIAEGSVLVHRGTISSVQLHNLYGASLSIQNTNVTGNVVNDGYGLTGLSGTDISGVTGNGLFQNNQNGGMRFLSNNQINRLDNAGSTKIFGGLTASGTLMNQATGFLDIMLNANVSAAVIQNAGVLTINSGATLTATNYLENQAGGIILGIGTLNANVTINNGSIIAPGSSPGVLTTGSQIWNGGGTYQFEINNALGTAGVNWDLLTINGVLNIQANSNNRFVFDIDSLAMSGLPGMASNFDSNSNYDWRLASASGGIVGYSPTSFQLNLASFLNSYSGQFSITSTGNDLFLSYRITAVPEPSSAVLCLAMLGSAVIFRRSRNWPLSEN